MGFLAKTKMKAYTKLTVIMCCQIIARKSEAQLAQLAAISGGERRRGTPVDKIRNFGEKKF